MYETESMIVPQRIETVKPIDSVLNVAYRLVDGKVLERVIYQKNEALVYRALTDIHLRTHFLTKPILNAFYHDFGSISRPNSHLCIASEDELKLICIETNECHTIALPIKIQVILPTIRGLLLVRSEHDDSDSCRGPGILYSLSHPYSELLPVLCQLKGKDNKPFIFIRRNIQLIPSYTESHLVLGYDMDEDVNYLFTIRPYTELEKQSARESLMEATLALNNSRVDTLRHVDSLPRVADDLTKSEVTPTQRSTGSFFGTPPSFSQPQPSWQRWLPKLRRLSDSQLFTTVHEQSQSDSAAARLFSTLSQSASQSRHVNSQKATGILSAITGEVETEFDQNALELALECIWTHENRPNTKSPSRLPIFSSLQTSAPISQRSNRARTKLGKEITEQFEKNSCVTNNRPSQTFTTSNLNNRNYFVFSVPGKNEVRILPCDSFSGDAGNKLSTFKAKHAAPLLGTKYWISAQNSPVLVTLFSGSERIADVTISCVIREPEVLILNHINQLICRDGTEFEMIAEFRPTIEPSPTKEPVLKKARHGIVSPQKRHLYWSDPFETVITAIRSKSENQALPSVMLVDSPAPKSLRAVYSQPSTSDPFDDFVLPKPDGISSNTYLVKVQLNSGTITSMGKRVHDTVLNSLSDRNKLEFEKEWLCKNTFRLVHRDSTKMIELETAALFEVLFEAIGVSPSNFPFMNLVKKAKGLDASLDFSEGKTKIKRDNEKHMFLDEFMAQIESSEQVPLMAQRIEARLAIREPFITPDHAVLVFRALHKLFDSFKRNKDDCVLRVRRSMSQPMFILAGFYRINKASRFYADLYPELNNLQVMPLRQQPRISCSNEGSLSFDAIDHLCDSFELDFATNSTAMEPVLTNTQRNKLRVLPTQSEIAKWIKLRWPTDIRVYNVSTMLDSSKPVLIPEKFLVSVALRTITRSFGAAFLNYHSKQAEPMETAVTEKISLHGKISPGNTKLEYPTQDQPQAKASHRQMMEWANFYNGVSRGLSTILNSGDNMDFGLSDQLGTTRELKRVKQVIASQSQCQIASELQIQPEDRNPRRQASEEDGPSVVDWEWVFSKIKENKEFSPPLAGFILAAGLSGQSMSVNPFDLHEFLSLSDKLVVVSLLLGTSVAYRGTSNFYINKMIYAHLPFLLQPTLCDFRIEPVIQTVALLSLGCLFAKSMNVPLTNDLINQMSKEAFFETDLSSERYAYVLSVGFAVGLINLGKGREIEMMEKLSVNDNHLSFHERLLLLLNGGRRDLCIVNYQKDPCVIAQKGCCSCGMSRSDQKFQPSQHHHHHKQRADCVMAAGSGNIRGGISSLDLGGGGASGAAGNLGSVASNVAAASSHVSELSTINIHLSSPAACVAFALVYMRTNLDHIARKLAVPFEIYSISLIRPDVIMLRTLASCLIMFDSISNRSDWVMKQIPPILRVYVNRRISVTNDKNRAEFPMLLRAYIYVRTGACFALALKYTSTRDEQTTRIIMQWFNELVEDFEKDEEWDSRVKICGVNTYVACINVTMSALAIVNASSGDVSLIRQFRRVRNYNIQFTSATREGSLYSTHVIANMCLGLLFLGNGRYGLSSSSMSLASLLIAFFPVYGSSVSDNRCYFQGFRFMWTLAVEPRFLVTVAEGFQEAVAATLEIVFKNENMKPIIEKTPYLLPPLEWISIIRIRASDFQPVDLDLQKPEDMRTLREILVSLFGRLPLKRRKRACGSHEFRTLDPNVLVENDEDLNSNCSEHSFSDNADDF